MNLRKLIKRDTKLVILSVIILTIVTMNLSYSYVFSVKSYTTGNNIQQFSTGTLNVTVTNQAYTSNLTLLPTTASSLPTTKASSATGSAGTNYAKITITNTQGTLDAEYGITIGPDKSNLPTGKTINDLIDLQYVNIGVYNETSGQTGWFQFGTKFYTSISSLTASSADIYPIYRNTINKNTTQTLRIYVWLADNTPVSEIGKLVRLKVDVKSTTVNGQTNGNGLTTPSVKS